ncbi:vacuolar protein sorting-associated protein 5 [Diutina catenulata]
MDQEDLTASHWDDVLPSSQSNYSQFDNVLGHDAWGGSSRTKAYGEPDSEEEEEEEQPEAPKDTNDNTETTASEFPAAKPSSAPDADNHQHNWDRQQQSAMVSELTSELGAHDPFAEPAKTASIPDDKALFNDKGADPLKLVGDAPAAKSQKFSVPKPRKYSKKTVQHLSAATVGPLEGAQSPKKPSRSASSTYDQLVSEVNAPLFERETKPTAQTSKTADEPAETATQTSAASQVSETDGPAPPPKDEPANRQYHVYVGDPIKVGELTNAHIEYSVKTKYRENPSDAPQVWQVTHRYRDFRWLYNQLQNNHPGRIIPPPPDKQTYIGRFNESFIENRRLSLEKMLTKLLDRAIFRDDPDLQAFLKQEDLEITSELADGELDEAEAGAASSFMGFFNSGPKVEEVDPWFTQQKDYVDELESNLKQFLRALELIGTQRYDLVALYDEISLTIDELAALEVSKTTQEVLAAFAEVQLKLKQNLDRVNMQDQLTLGFTIEEYLRVIGSINHVLDTRTKLWAQLYQYQQDLAKKAGQLEKQKRRNAVADTLQFEVNKLKEKTEQYDHRFREISSTIRSELGRFELERIADFRNAVEIYVEASIESHKEAIEVYETFYERQGLGGSIEEGEAAATATAPTES